MRFEAVAVFAEVVVMVATFGVVPTCVQVPLLATVPTRLTAVIASQYS